MSSPDSKSEVGAETAMDPSAEARSLTPSSSGSASAEVGSAEFYAGFDAPGLTEEERAQLTGGVVAPGEGRAFPEAPGVNAPGAGQPPAAETDSRRPSATPSAPVRRPSFVFFGVVAALSLTTDIGTKVWAEMTLNERGFEPLELIANHLSVTLAYNRGGAWGLFSTADDLVRKPFFLAVSIAAIAFIISLYSKLQSQQKALAWGLPLVLGGALGNLSDRITRSQVIDFIDYRADWVMSLNSFVQRYVPSWTVTDHWPTFNVADIAICIGVGLMAVDMFTHRPRRHAGMTHLASVPPEAPPAVG